jgi:hypothetical protein
MEYVSPKNRVVLAYPEECVWCLGAVITETGEDVLPENIGPHLSIPFVQATDMALFAALKDASTATGIEGYVARWRGGFRVKIKTVEYVGLHRLITGLSVERIHRAMAMGLIDSFVASMPEELRPGIEQVISQINERVEQRFSEVTRRFFTLRSQTLGGDRKAFAQATAGHPDRTLLFLLYDHRDIRPPLLENVDLTGIVLDNAAYT